MILISPSVTAPLWSQFVWMTSQMGENPSFSFTKQCLSALVCGRELLTEVNVAPAQLHPNGWAFVRAFQILCGYLGLPPSVDVFLHFFEVKKQGKSIWGSFYGVASRILFTLFQNSFKGWKGNFFRVCCAKHDPT